MIPEANRFHSDPDGILADSGHLMDGWRVETPDPSDRFTIARLTTLLREHERAGRGWAGASVDDVLVEVSERGLRMRENVVVRDPDGEIRAWGSVHDRAEGRMLFVHVVERDLPDDRGRRLRGAAVLVGRGAGPGRSVPPASSTSSRSTPARSPRTPRQHDWLEQAGFERVRTWFQMTRPVAADEAGMVPDPAGWQRGDVTIRRVRRRDDDGLPDAVDLHAVHQVLEQAFRDHFNSWEETFGEFVHRVREDPGHRWDHWWLAELAHEDLEGIGPIPVGALVGTHLESSTGPRRVLRLLHRRPRRRPWPGRRQGAAPHDHRRRRRRAAATASGSRSTPTRRPARAASTSRSAGRRPTSPSRGTATCPVT